MTQRPSPLAAVSPTQERRRLQIEWLSELEPSTEARWLVDKLVPAGGLVAMIGPPTAGKTFLAIDLAAHVASGRDWFGHPTERGLVLYVGGEDPDGLRMRLIAARDYFQLDEGDPLAFLESDLNLLRAGDLDLLAEEIARASAVSDLPVALVIIDTLSRTFGDGDENSADMAAYVRQLGLLQSRFGCAVMVLHHPPKNPVGRTPRGHSSLPAACDTLLMVAGRKPRRLIVDKQRNGPAGMAICFELRPAETESFDTCIIEQAEPGARLEGGRRLSTDEHVMMEQLVKLSQSPSSALPADVPDDVLAQMQSSVVVSLAEWEQAAKPALHTRDRKSDSVRKAFQRARDRLVDNRAIGIWRDWVWLIE